MPDGYQSVILYHPSDPDIAQVLLRARDLVAFVNQSLFPGADRAGHEPDPDLSFADPPASLLWWLCSLQVTLDSLYCYAVSQPAEPLATALQAYLAQHPEQASAMRQILVEALARDFVRWDQVQALIQTPQTPR